MATFYLASSFRLTKEQMRAHRAELEARGDSVTSRWIDSTEQSDPLEDPAACQLAAIECLEDIEAADCLILFTAHGSVGKHVEFGYALAIGKPICVVGAPTSVFHFAPNTARYPTWEAFLCR